MTRQHVEKAAESRVGNTPFKKALLAACAAIVASAALAAPHAGAQVAPADQRAVSGENEANGLPVSYTDARGHQVFQCLGDAELCGIEDPAAPVEEVVYWSAERTKISVGRPDARGRTGEASIVMAVEGALDADAGGAPITGGVISIRADGLRPNTVYKVSHPYGNFSVRTLADGSFPRNAKTLVEHGCDIEIGEECDFGLALDSPLFNNFLRPAGVSWNTAEHLGNAEGTSSTVVGSLVKNAAGKPQNYFKIEGPQAGGAGKSVKKVSKFAVTGQLAQDTETDPAPPDEEAELAE